MAFGLLNLPSALLFARDWPEPAAALHPRAFKPAGYVELNYQVFHASDEDSFQINVASSAGLLDIGESFHLGLRYGAFLMNGPVLAGDVPGSRLQWMMNAVQFAYGLHAAWDLGGFDLLAEYSRASQHPFRPRFSQVTYDRILVGVGRPGGPWGPLPFLAASIRAGWVDLFDFWQSPIRKPRTEWLARLGLAAEWAPWTAGDGGAEHRLFLEASPDLFLLRDGGVFDATLAARAGLRLAGENQEAGGAVYDFYFDLFLSRDTEQRDDRPTPVALLGLGFRINAGR